jgi:hypothetical protein
MTGCAEARADQEVYCALRARYLLIIDRVCFSRSRDDSCRNCIFDKDPITVRLLWELCDIIEDSEEEAASAQGETQLRGVQS